MKYHIDEHSGEKAYLQLYYQLRADITGGVFPLGARLPSKRILAEESGVSVITVEHTYALLCDEGYVETRQRSGSFVIYRQDDCERHINRIRRRAQPPCGGVLFICGAAGGC